MKIANGTAHSAQVVNMNVMLWLSASQHALIYCLLYSITILHLLALFMDMKPDTTNCVCRMLLPDLDNEY